MTAPARSHRVPQEGDPAGQNPRPVRTRLADALDRNVLVVLLLGALAACLLAALAPSQIVGDTWMTLVAGREVATGGLPDVDPLTVFGEGRRWTDQQWLAQLIAYGSWKAGGLALVVLVAIAFVVTALGLAAAAARSRGGSPLACALVLIPAIVAAPWAWTVRAQVYALPLYVATLWFALDARETVRRRTFGVLAVLVVWANVHGSVVLGALVVVVAGGIQAARRDAARAARLRGLALAALAPLAVLVTPYPPTRILDYYRLFFLDSPFEGLLTEWQRTGLAWETTTFWVGAAATALLCVRHRRRLSLLEAIVLALTAVGAVQAIRGIVWFALAALVIVPNLLTGVLGRRAVLRARGANLVLGGLVAGAVVVAAASLLARGDEPLERDWPSAALPAIAAELDDPATRVWGTDRHADWLLWKLPALRGRLSWDVRFEVYTREQIESTVRWNGRIGSDWPRVADDYRVVTLDAADSLDKLPPLLRDPPARIAHRDASIVVLVRASG